MSDYTRMADDSMDMNIFISHSVDSIDCGSWVRRVCRARYSEDRLADLVVDLRGDCIMISIEYGMMGRFVCSYHPVMSVMNVTIVYFDSSMSCVSFVDYVCVKYCKCGCDVAIYNAFGSSSRYRPSDFSCLYFCGSIIGFYCSDVNPSQCYSLWDVNYYRVRYGQSVTYSYICEFGSLEYLGILGRVVRICNV